jgi:hypothetical protein
LKKLELTRKRIARREKYTIGRLYIDGKYFCDTIEDKDRGLSQALPVTVNKNLKRRGVTAIPVGRYRVTLDMVSPKFSKKTAYQFCGGRLPRLINVPAFDGVLIHIGNTANDTEGCILVGKNKQVGKVLDSTVTFRALYEVLKQAKDTIYITVE